MAGGRQAVVVVHGIGEQRPMDTLRSLLRGLRLTPYRNRRDRLSDTVELRRLILDEEPDVRPTTDFYELYWADLADRGTVREALGWAWRLLWRRAGWRGTRIALALNILTLLSSLLIGATLAILVVPSWRGPVMQVGLRTPFWIVLVLALLSSTVGYFLSRTVCDAARYLTPRPENVRSRAAIRHRGVTLLRGLHESGRYGRIVVLGHSLGSVVAYDVLRTYWVEAREPDRRRAGPQPAVEGFREAAAALAAERPPTPARVESFQEAQDRLWREQRRRGVPWLVTDFLTVGSPLAHGRMVLGNHVADLDQLVAEGELPACPPRGDHEESGGFYRVDLPGQEADGTPYRWTFELGDQAAPFASTRWTNLFFPVHGVVLGDLVGGPVAPVFGRGVRDVAVARTPQRGIGRLLAEVFPVPHTAYWTPPGHGRRRWGRDLPESGPTLLARLGLDIDAGPAPCPPADDPVGSPDPVPWMD